MGREIKFRAFGQINKHMYPVAFPSWNGRVEGKIDLISHKVEEIEQDGDEVPILMQFTGLKDRNGVDIFEGDIIRTSIDFEEEALPHMGAVVYCTEYASFATRNDAGDTLFHNHYVNTREVVGNFYEHPHLLGAK